MAYKAFLIERYDYSHENIFFRQINDQLKTNFENKNGLYILIGNVSIGGHHLDAIFIKNGAVIVIDFKDYEGFVSFSENGPWKLTDKDGKMIFVAGGAKSRNPFQQVNAYRFALFQLLSEKENLILEDNHTVKWDHTNSLVLFQREIEYDSQNIPAKITRFFHITDINDYLKRLDDLNSNSLNLTDDEIRKILTVLSIDTTNEYDSAEDIEEEKDKHEIKYTPDQIEKIKKLIPKEKDIPLDIIDKSLLFYNAMINLERLNESTVNDIHQYKVDWSTIDISNYKLDITLNKSFLDIFETNKTKDFPQNLFISIDVSFDKIKAPLFYTIVFFPDIDDIGNLQINFNNFSLFTPILTELQLTENIIQELTTVIIECKNINAKIQEIEKILEIDIKLSNSISLGLSTESLYTVQLQAEFKNWINKKVLIPKKTSVFKSILTKEILPQDKINDINYIQITQLNNSQKKAVKTAFNQYVSIITGPPGTGKSQVVMNILANGVYNNQKILFASKNNKAVDNVYERLNSLLNTDYFIRLGNNEINLKTIEKIHLFKSQKNTKAIKDLNNEFEDSQLQIKFLLDEKESINYKIEQIPILENKSIELNTQEKQYKTEYDSWLNRLQETDRQLYINDSLNFDSILNSEINRNIQMLKNTNGFFKKISFNIFQKKTVSEYVIKINQSLQNELKKYIDSNAPYYAEGLSEIDSLKQNLAFVLKEKQKQEKIQKKHIQYLRTIKTLETEINNTETELKEHKDHLDEYNDSLLKLEVEFIETSQKALLLNINQKIFNANVSVLDSYSGYLSNGIPWKKEEKKKFSNKSHQFIETFNAISISNLTIKKAFLQEPEIFDLLIIDEASQCDIASVLPLVFRAKRLVVLGDPLQLPHITSVNKYKQQYAIDKLGLLINDNNYINNSFFDKAESISNHNQLNQIFLNEHFRCHPQIIDFSNINFYLAKAGQELIVRTSPEDFKFGNQGFNWINVVGEVKGSKNINIQEVEKCLELTSQLRTKFPKASIGITTPFKHQKQELINALKHIENITIDTVNGFQGDEKDIMLFSLVVSTNCKSSLPRFINEYSSYLLNVGITRAKSALYIIGNKDYCKTLKTTNNQKSLLAKLAEYDEIK